MTHTQRIPNLMKEFSADEAEQLHFTLKTEMKYPTLSIASSVSDQIRSCTRHENVSNDPTSIY